MEENQLPELSPDEIKTNKSKKSLNRIFGLLLSVAILLALILIGEIVLLII